MTRRGDAIVVLSLNVGSSSLKYELSIVASNRVVARPFAGSIAGFGAHTEIREALAGVDLAPRRGRVSSPLAATQVALARARAIASELELAIDVVANRIVHGGSRFVTSTILDSAALSALARLTPFAPNHQEDALEAARFAKRTLPDAVHVGVFDTAFHATMPESAWRLPIPSALANRLGLRRYGFHGLAFESVMEQLPRLLDRPRARVNAILFHLGSGCSACAVENGASIDTTMGVTPLDGLMMRTRSGAIDPSIPLLLARALDAEPHAIERLLTHESGLLGVGGHGGDVRELLRRERRDPHARVALAMFVARIRKQLGAYLVLLPRVDAIVFSGGIGEGSAILRARFLDGLSRLGIELDARRNSAPDPGGAAITRRGSRIPAFVIPADEAAVLEIAAARAVTEREASGRT